MLLYLFVALVINLVLFLIAYRKQTDKLTDITYSFTFIFLLVISFFLHSFSLVKVVLLLMVVIWALRLGGFLWIRINRMGTDERFDEMRTDFWSFGKFWLLQGFSVFVISIPSLFFMRSSFEEVSAVTIIGFFIWLTGFALETIADFQKFQFKSNPQNKGKWISSGLYQYMRHPNYLGELLVWYGIYLFVLPALTNIQLLVGLLSPLFITILLLFVSGIPLLEKSAQKKWGSDEAYLAYKNKTGKLFPKNFGVLLLSIAITQFAGLLGALFTATSVDNWYVLLQKPSWNPPDWVFGPVWTALYFLMAVAAFLVWKKRNLYKVSLVLGLYLLHLAVNVLWSVLFFYFHEIDLAFISLILLWMLILILTYQFYKIEKITLWFMLPYLCWVTFAGVLNYSIVLLNG